jgi:hypothetical protein
MLLQYLDQLAPSARLQDPAVVGLEELRQVLAIDVVVIDDADDWIPGCDQARSGSPNGCFVHWRAPTLDLSKLGVPD